MPDRLFRIVIVNRLVAPANIVPGLKVFDTVGVGIPVTFRVALAGLVLLMLDPPAPVALSAPTGIVLIKLPVVMEVTFTLTVQEPAVEPTWAGTVPPLRDKLVAPLTAVTVPPHELVTPGALAIFSPGWMPTKLSAHDVFVNAKTFGLKIVMLKTDV